ARAVLLGCVACLGGGLLGRRLGGAAVTACVGLLAANATAEAVAGQYRARASTPVTFERTVHVFRQIHAACPNPPPDALVLLVLDERIPSPFQTNHGCMEMGRRLLGARMIPTVRDALPLAPVCRRRSVCVVRGDSSTCYQVGYDRVLAFRLAPDGTVSLL